MTEPVYSDTLSNYLERVENFTPTERSAHLREDYFEEDQLWPEYLDYCEDWEYYFEDKLKQVRMDFIFSVLAKRRQTIMCGTHTHTFSTDPNDQGADVIITNTDATLNEESCWFYTLTVAERWLNDHDSAKKASRLSVPETVYLKKMISLRLVLDSNTTPTKLDFKQFQTRWWKQDTRRRALELLEESMPNNDYFKIQEAIEQLREEHPVAKPKWLHPSTEQPQVIFGNAELYTHHGLHALMRVRSDSHAIFDIINDIRSEDANHFPLKAERLAEAMEKCKHCTTIKPSSQAVTTTFCGVYYSPPGNGKTTALETEAFVGVDTDWLLKMSDFNTMLAPFLRRGIPILTNQYHLSVNAGTKFIGTFNTSHLRIDPITQQPYTTLREILSARMVMKDDLLVITHADDTKYFTHDLLSLLRIQHIYELTRIQFMSKQDRKFWSEPKNNMTTQATITMIRKWHRRARNRHKARKTKRTKGLNQPGTSV